VECLKKSVRISSQCMDATVQTQLFVELLNHYVYFVEKGVSDSGGSGAVEGVGQILSKIAEELPNLEENEERSQIQKHYDNTVTHIRAMALSTPNLYAGVDLDNLAPTTTIQA